MKTKIAAVMFLLLPMISFSQPKAVKTPEDVVNQIKKHVTCEWADETVDTFKAGDSNAELKGIAVCMFADMATLKKAVKEGCNFIITHEPIFYNHLDEVVSFKNDRVFQEKMKFIEDNNLVIFRFHDHIHRTEPDGIYKGMIEKMDITAYSQNGSQTFFNIPEIAVADFAKQIKKLFDIESIRLIGNPDMKFTKLAFAAGAPGGQRHIKLLQNPEVEVLIAGEAPEWETYLYANDATEQGKNKAVIFLGHIKSEEAGMEYCAEWLKTFIKNVPVKFIENSSNFTVF